jgi:3-oxoacyl-[acyl-carrier protein] reductase
MLIPLSGTTPFGRGGALDLGLQGKTVLVTGASQGIGRETARRFLEEGARVAISSRDRSKIDRARDELSKETGGEVHALVGDMSVGGDPERVVREAIQKLGTLHVLVNNAGTMYSGRFEALTDEGLQKQLDTKLFGFMRAIRAASPAMTEQRWGRVVNIIGGAGKEPDPYMFGSGITNSALLNITKSLSTEFAPFNVLINAVCPGWVGTDLWQRNAAGYAAEIGVESKEEALRRATSRNAMGRFGKPQELADAIAFLCSERASYITGVSLNVDGGRLKGLW